MSERSRRQETILSVITRKPIRTQEELLEELARKGVELTQSTLSRELRALGVVKGPDGRGGYRYLASGAGAAESPLSTVTRFIRSVGRAQNLLVVKTPPGHAMSVARAIDQADWPEVLGTLGGDDTILLVCNDNGAAGRVERRLKLIAER